MQNAYGSYSSRRGRDKDDASVCPRREDGPQQERDLQQQQQQQQLQSDLQGRILVACDSSNSPLNDIPPQADHLVPH